MDIQTLIQTFHIDIFLKASTLVLLLLYILFTIIVLNQVRSLNRLVTIEQGKSSLIVFSTTIIYVAATISLFVFALAIL